MSGAGGVEIEAYLARPLGDDRRGGVVVIHHMPGYDRATKEMTRRLAVLGYDALCPNLFWREAPGADPDDASAAVRALGGVPDERLVGDVAAAADHLRQLPQATGRIGVIGHCSGGRQAVLTGCHIQIDAVVDCYGAYVTGDPRIEAQYHMGGFVVRWDHRGREEPPFSHTAAGQRLAAAFRDRTRPRPASPSEFTPIEERTEDRTGEISEEGSDGGSDER